MIYRHLLKRSFDLIFSLFLLILFTPVILCLMVLIRIKMGKSVFFSQERGGINGTVFKIIKSRTMLKTCDTNHNILSDEQRLTNFGRFLRSSSLDELPSLFNVLRGDISLVGPRPFVAEYLEHYNEYQKKRHLVKPGITGWAQVNGRNAITWERKFDLDIWYVNHQSVLLDMRILWLTFLRVVNRKDINSYGHETMPSFLGSNDSPL